MWNALEVEQLTAGVQDRLLDFTRPDVLPDEQGGGRIGLKRVPHRADVVLVQEAVDLHAEILQSRAHLGIELGQLESDDVAVLGLADEGQVDDANRPGFHQVGDRGCDLAAELVAGKREDREVDRSDLFHASLLFRIRDANDIDGQPARPASRAWPRFGRVACRACPARRGPARGPRPGATRSPRLAPPAPC